VSDTGNEFAELSVRGNYFGQLVDVQRFGHSAQLSNEGVNCVVMPIYMVGPAERIPVQTESNLRES
jgi:hypothetical protein